VTLPILLLALANPDERRPRVLQRDRDGFSFKLSYLFRM